MQRWTLLAFLFLLGCTPTLAWDRMGRNEEQFARDKKECQIDTRLAVGHRFQPPPAVEYRTADGLRIPQASPWSGSRDLGRVFQEQALERQLFHLCMETRGYRIAEGASRNK